MTQPELSHSVLRRYNNNSSPAVVDWKELDGSQPEPQAGNLNLDHPGEFSPVAEGFEDDPQEESTEKEPDDPYGFNAGNLERNKAEIEEEIARVDEEVLAEAKAAALEESNAGGVTESQWNVSNFQDAGKGLLMTLSPSTQGRSPSAVPNERYVLYKKMNSRSITICRFNNSEGPAEHMVNQLLIASAPIDRMLSQMSETQLALQNWEDDLEHHSEMPSPHRSETQLGDVTVENIEDQDTARDGEKPSPEPNQSVTRIERDAMVNGNDLGVSHVAPEADGRDVLRELGLSQDDDDQTQMPALTIPYLSKEKAQMASLGADTVGPAAVRMSPQPAASPCLVAESPVTQLHMKEENEQHLQRQASSVVPDSQHAVDGSLDIHVQPARDVVQETQLDHASEMCDSEAEADTEPYVKAQSHKEPPSGLPGLSPLRGYSKRKVVTENDLHDETENPSPVKNAKLGDSQDPPHLVCPVDA